MAVNAGPRSGLKKAQVPKLKKVSNIKKVLPENAQGSTYIILWKKLEDIKLSKAWINSALTVYKHFWQKGHRNPQVKAQKYITGIVLQ